MGVAQDITPLVKKGSEKAGLGQSRGTARLPAADVPRPSYLRCPASPLGLIVALVQPDLDGYGSWLRSGIEEQPGYRDRLAGRE